MPTLGELTRVLSIDELERAARFARSADRDGFVLRRGLLRTVLSRYTDREPSAITLVYGRFGKPLVHASSRTGRLFFNLAHSGPVVLIAVTADRAVGVDLEAIDSTRDVDAVAALYLADGDAIRQLPLGQRSREFFNAWTRQEAYLKARGWGLTQGPADYRAARTWTIEPLTSLPGYAGAVAARGCDWRINWRSAVASSARCSVRQVT